MNKFKFIDLFCGIGGFHVAAAQNGGKCVFACDIDVDARKAYKANYGLEPKGDITSISELDIPDHDMLCAGFPCQPFSIIGNRLGFDDIRGTLFFDIVRILEVKKPNFVVLENVKQLSTHNRGKTLEKILVVLRSLGYSVSFAVLNALNYGLPQKESELL